jgi:hypothetical protein
VMLGSEVTVSYGAEQIKFSSTFCLFLSVLPLGSIPISV